MVVSSSWPGSGHELAGVNGGSEPPEIALVLLGVGLGELEQLDRISLRR